MDASKIEDIDGALISLFSSSELWVAIGAIIFLFVAMLIKKSIDARSDRLFGKHRFNLQSDISIGHVYWFGNATGADPWVLVGVDSNYMRFEDKARVRFIPTKQFPGMQWTISKILSSEDVLSGLYAAKIDSQDAVSIIESIISKSNSEGDIN